MTPSNVRTSDDQKKQDELTEDLRREFLQLVESSPEDYDPTDIERLKTKDFPVRRFLIHNKLKVRPALRHLESAMKWRKSLDVNRVSTWHYYPTEMARAGLCFIYNKDREGRPVVYNRIRKDIPITKSDMWTNVIMTTMIETLDRLGGKRGHVSVLDFSEIRFYVPTKDEIKVFINHRKIMNFYPENLAMIILYNLPWILKKIVVPLVKMAVGDWVMDKVKTVDGDQLFQYIDRSQVPQIMGGDCLDSVNEPPSGCVRSCDEIAPDFGLTVDDMKQYRDKIKVFIDETNELMKKLNRIEDCQGNGLVADELKADQ